MKNDRHYKPKKYFFNYKTFKFLVIKNLDLDPDSPKSLDPGFSESGTKTLEQQRQYVYFKI